MPCSENGRVKEDQAGSIRWGMKKLSKQEWKKTWEWQYKMAYHQNTHKYEHRKDIQADTEHQNGIQLNA